jgi:hypothetical protein
MPMPKQKDGGPVPSKTIQFTDFKKGLMRTGARDGIPDEALWESLNAQVIGPGHIATLTDPAPSITSVTPEVVSLWGVMIAIKPPGVPQALAVESARLIAICEDGSAVAIDPATGAQTPICPAGSLDPAARLTMWRDSHVLFVGPTTGYASWDGLNYLVYPATFEGTTTDGSSSIVWVDGPTPAEALSAGMAISGPGISPGAVILGVGSEDLPPPGTFTADTVSGFPTLLWTSGPALPQDLEPGVVVSGTGIPANATILSVVGEELPAAAPFSANTVAASSQIAYTGGLTASEDLKPGLRVVGAGIPAGATLVAANGTHLEVGSTFDAKTTSAKNTIDWLGGATTLERLVSGVVVTGPGIPAGTTIKTISGFTITLSKNATATAALVSLTVWPSLTLSVNATATATNVPVTTGPTILISANATATGSTVTLTVRTTLTIGPGPATASGTVTLTIGAGAPRGTVADPESAGPRDIAVFEGRAWLVSGNRGLIYTGPGSFTAFGLIYAGDTASMPDSVFPGQITTIRAAIQLLWIFGPGAINTISNVAVVTNRTIYQNENLVAGTGTALADSVAPLFRTMAFLSPSGVYAILGATPQKLSDQLDGIMPQVAPVATCPAAVFNLNSLLVYAVLVELEGVRRLLIYSRPTWLVGEQGTDLKWITTVVRTDGQIQGWGTNGTTIRRLFAGEAGDYDIRLKQFDFDMFTRRDTIRRIAVQAEVIPRINPLAFDPDMQVEVENESTTKGTVGGVIASEVTWINDALEETPWINNVAAPVTWVAQGNLIFLSEVKFSGNLLSAHIYGRRSVPLIIGGVAMEIGVGGEWTFAP